MPPFRSLAAVRSPVVALAAFILALGGCRAGPINVASLEEPALDRIHGQFEVIVAEAHADPKVNWHSGWVGNFIVNWNQDPHYGLCYHWQEWVYDQIEPAVNEQRWAAVGIVINENTKHEHHGVIVYDPARIREGDLLTAEPPSPAFVLDAWRRGRADVYEVADWIAMPLKIVNPPHLERLPITPLPFSHD